MAQRSSSSSGFIMLVLGAIFAIIALTTAMLMTQGSAVNSIRKATNRTANVKYLEDARALLMSNLIDTEITLSTAKAATSGFTKTTLKQVNPDILAPWPASNPNEPRTGYKSKSGCVAIKTSLDAGDDSYVSSISGYPVCVMVFGFGSGSGGVSQVSSSGGAALNSSKYHLLNVDSAVDGRNFFNPPANDEDAGNTPVVGVGARAAFALFLPNEDGQYYLDDVSFDAPGSESIETRRIDAFLKGNNSTAEFEKRIGILGDYSMVVSFQSIAGSSYGASNAACDTLAADGNPDKIKVSYENGGMVCRDDNDPRFARAIGALATDVNIGKLGYKLTLTGNAGYTTSSGAIDTSVPLFGLEEEYALTLLRNIAGGGKCDGTTAAGSFLRWDGTQFTCGVDQTTGGIPASCDDGESIRWDTAQNKFVCGAGGGGGDLSSLKVASASGVDAYGRNRTLKGDVAHSGTDLLKLTAASGDLEMSIDVDKLLSGRGLFLDKQQGGFSISPVNGSTFDQPGAGGLGRACADTASGVHRKIMWMDVTSGNNRGGFVCGVDQEGIADVRSKLSAGTDATAIDLFTVTTLGSNNGQELQVRPLVDSTDIDVRTKHGGNALELQLKESEGVIRRLVRAICRIDPAAAAAEGFSCS